MKVIVTRVVDMKPITLYFDGQADGGVNYTCFEYSPLPSKFANFVHGLWHCHFNPVLVDDTGSVTLRLWHSEDEDAVALEDMLLYLVCFAPW